MFYCAVNAGPYCLVLLVSGCLLLHLSVLLPECFLLSLYLYVLLCIFLPASPLGCLGVFASSICHGLFTSSFPFDFDPPLSPKLLLHLNVAAADYRRLQLCPSEPKGGSPWSSFLSLVSRGPLAEEAQRAPSGLSRGPSRAVLCLSNFTCFVEVLYLQMRLCPFFLGLHKDGSLSVLSFWGAIKYSLSFEVSIFCCCSQMLVLPHYGCCLACRC